MTKTLGLLSEVDLLPEKLNWDSSDILKFIKFDLIPVYLTEEDYLKLSYSLKSLATVKRNKAIKSQFSNLLRTRPIDKKSPELYCRALLTRNQYNKLIEYLNKNQFYLNSFGKENKIAAALALSFGKNNEVNRELARKLEDLYYSHSNLPVFAQYEVYDLIGSRRKYKNIIRLGDKRSKYITTNQIVDKFLEDFQITTPGIALVAQSWHAPRCIEICNSKGLDVVQGEFVNKFSPEDTQPWVRDVLSWIIKEAQK